MDKSLRWLEKIGVHLDEANVTGLETWHPLGQEFCPSVALVFPELWVRITAPFRGSLSSGWAWNHHSKDKSSDLAPDQARLAFAVGNALASLTMDGIVARIDPEDERPLKGLGALILVTEQEGILEGEETLAMRALRLGAEEGTASEAGPKPVLGVSWGNAQIACREPLGRIRKVGVEPIQEEDERRVLKRSPEVIEDLLTWEESLSCVTLLGPEHQRPIRPEGVVLPSPPRVGILRHQELDTIRRANERLGLDPDDLDYAKERFAQLRVTEDVKREFGRTPSPPPAPNSDVHGLWAEEKHRQSGGRHRGPPRLRWNPPVRREDLKKRHRDPEGQVEGWGDPRDKAESRPGHPSLPPSKRTREGSRREGDEEVRERPEIARGRARSFRSSGRSRGFVRSWSEGRGRGTLHRGGWETTRWTRRGSGRYGGRRRR